MWSSLPWDILAYIKDKVDIFDTASVNSVCRNWWLASKNYRERQTVGDGMPWIMQSGFMGNNLEVIRYFAKQKKITILLPGLRKGKILYSKKGWVLIQLCENSQTYQQLPHQFMLLNPLTKARIYLPLYANRSNKCMLVYTASFSIKNDRPHRVVLYARCSHCRCAPGTLSITEVGDEMWVNHSYETQDLCIEQEPIDLLTIGETVYICYHFGKMIIYNVATREQKQVGRRLGVINMFARFFYMEHDGEVLICANKVTNSIDSDLFYCYDSSINKWMRMNDGFKDDKNIFFHRYNGCFMCSGQSRYKVQHDPCLYDYIASWGIISPALYGFGSTWVDIG